MDKKKMMELISSMKSSLQNLEAACGGMGEEMPESEEEMGEEESGDEGQEENSGKKALIVSMLKKKQGNY